MQGRTHRCDRSKRYLLIFSGPFSKKRVDLTPSLVLGNLEHIYLFLLVLPFRDLQALHIAHTPHHEETVGRGAPM